MTNPVIYLFDGFDDYGTGNQAALQSRCSPPFGAGTAAISGTIAGAFSGVGGATSNCCLYIPLPSPQSTLVLGARFLTQLGSGGNNSAALLSFVDASGVVLVQVCVSDLGSLKVTRGGNTYYINSPYDNMSGTSLYTGAAGAPIVANVWFELEVKVTIGTTTGAVQVFINGVSVLNLTNVNTQGSGASAVSYVGIAAANGAYYFDDLYASDTVLTTIAGPMGPRVYTDFPIADDGVTWTPSSGANNYSQVAESAFDGDTSYVSTATAGNTDLYNIAALTGSTQVLAVQTAIVARMDDAGYRTVATVLNSGGTNYIGATRNMSASYQKFVDLYQNDPATSAAWVASKFTGTPSVHGGYTCIS